MNIEQNLNAILNRTDLIIKKRQNTARVFNAEESYWDINTKEKYIGTITRLCRYKNFSRECGSDETYKANMINGVEGYISKDLFIKMQNYTGCTAR